MLRRLVFGLAFVLMGVVLGSGLVLRAGTTNVAQEIKTPYVHAVVFYLKKDAPKDTAETMIKDAHEMLRPIPTVRELRIGRPADVATPDLAKKDFHLGLLILFDDAEGLLTYHNHPQHKRYVEKHIANVDLQKLGVYDFSNQKQ